jgi:RNA polymerase sigma factor (sigma-70 family)
LESPCRTNLTDARLLDLFVRQKDQSAFAILLHRYGPMVWHVTRRVLSNRHDTEDVFQATFLLLARKAASIRKQESVASWLHGVAYRLSVQLRRQALRRQARERRAPAASVPEPGFESAWRELQTVLDEELAGLPDKYRTPLVLCYLEGKTHEEAATALGWPVGTVRGRLARARDALRKRLGKRGMALTATAFATLLVGTTSTAAVPVALTNTTLLAAVQTTAGNTTSCLVSAQAATLVEGAMQSMMVAKMKLGLALLLILGLTLAGVGAMLPRGSGGAPLQPNTVYAADAKEKPAEPSPTEPAPGHDRLGDPMPPTALARLGTARMITNVTDRLLLVFSPDGKLVGLSSQDGSVALWDATNGKLVHRFEPRTANLNRFTGLLGFAVTPDNKAVATMDLAGKQIVPRDMTGKELRKLEITPEQLVASFLISPDGKTLATIEQSIQGVQSENVNLWDMQTGKLLTTLKGHTGSVFCVVFSPNSKSVFTGSNDQTLRRWEVSSGKELTVYDGHRDRVQVVAVSSDGKSVATASTDGTARIWDVESGKEIKQLASTSARLEQLGIYGASLAFAGDGKKLVLGTGIGLVVWDTPSGKVERIVLSPGGQAIPFVVSPDGRLTANAGYGQRIQVCDSISGKEAIDFEGHTGPVQAVAFAPNSKLLATTGQDRLIRLWEVPSGKSVRVLRGHLGALASLAFSPDGKYLVSASGDHQDRVVSLWNVSSGEEIRRYRGHGVALATVAFGAEGKIVVTVTKDNVAHVFETDTGKKVRDIKGLGTTHSVPADGKTIVSFQMMPNLPSATQLGGLMVHDLNTGELLRSVKAAPARQPMRPADPTDVYRNYPIDGMVFAPDGKMAATTISYTGQLILWDAESGKRVRQLVAARTPEEIVRRGPGAYNYGRIVPSFSPDGRFIAAPGKSDSLAIFEVATGVERRVLPTDQPSLSTLAFSPDGRVLASASSDSTVLLWDLSAPLPNEKAPAKELTDKELDALWTDLASDEGKKIERAVLGLAAAPKRAVLFLRKTLKPREDKKAADIDKLIADLDNDNFETRKSAETELARLGPQAKAAMQRALKDKPSLDVSKRLEELLSKLEDNPVEPEQARLLRGVEILERIGDKDAVEVLHALAKGAKDHPLTDDAKAALQRLKH